ncbi:tyrosine-type recombinase/integrase [Pseudomonas serbica]
MAIFTTKTIEAAVKAAQLLDADVWKTEDGARGEGRLRLRAFPHGGIAFYYRYSMDGLQRQLRIDRDTLTEARAKAAEYASLYRAGHRDLHTYLAQVQAEDDARREAGQRERVAQARQGTFAQLLEAYVVDMERRGKTSTKEVCGSLKLNVLMPFHDQIVKPAKDIQPTDVSAILRHCLTRPVASKGRGARLTKASASNGKKRQAAKLRAYLQAAFSFGLGFDLDPLRAADAVLFGLSTNPVRDVPTIEGANRAETWALTKDEVKAVLLAVEDLPERHRAIAKTMLYAAGQRTEMLTRVTWDDFYNDDEHGPVMQMWDLKGGKNTPPRVHLLPMTTRLNEVMSPLLALKGTGAPGPLSLRGERTATPGTLQGIFSAMGDQLAGQGKTRRFTWRHMRATCETHLASLGVNQERRAWLLSHGRSGVQAKHYDRYSYLPEKRADLEKWARYLDQLVSGEARSNVVPLHAGA